MRITISNPQGRSGREWRAEYDSIDDAADAIRRACGWLEAHIGESWDETLASSDRQVTCYGVYPTEDEAEKATDPYCPLIRVET